MMKIQLPFWLENTKIFLKRCLAGLKAQSNLVSYTQAIYIYFYLALNVNVIQLRYNLLPYNQISEPSLKNVKKIILTMRIHFEKI